MPGDLRLIRRDGSLPKVGFPLLADEGPGDGDPAVLADEALPHHDPGEDGEAVIRNQMAVHVADEPAACGIGAQPDQEGDDLLVGQVVGELRADDEVERRRGLVGEGVVGDEFDVVGRVGGGLGHAPRPGIEVDSGQPRLRMFPADAPQRVTVAVGDVEQGEAGAVLRLLRQPFQHRPVRQGQDVDLRQVAQAAAVLIEIDAVGVHQLRLRAAGGESHGRWKAKVSTVRPGPKAIAKPGPRASGSFRMAFRTNISVAEDMLPWLRSTSREKRSASGGRYRPCCTASRMDRPPAWTAHNAGCCGGSRAGPCSGSQRRMRPGTWPERCIRKPLSAMCQVIKSAERGITATWNRPSAMPCGSAVTRAAEAPSPNSRKLSIFGTSWKSSCRCRLDSSTLTTRTRAVVSAKTIWLATFSALTAAKQPMKPTMVRCVPSGSPAARMTWKSRPGAVKPVQLATTRCVTRLVSMSRAWTARSARCSACGSYCAMRAAVVGNAPRR